MGMIVRGGMKRMGVMVIKKRNKGGVRDCFLEEEIDLVFVARTTDPQ